MPEDQPQFLYRFRKIDDLIYKHHELEKHYIFFSPPDQLNDPMEGFKDIFWRGDDVAWQNFLRHYILIIMMSYLKVRIFGESFEISETEKLIRKTDVDLKFIPFIIKYEEVCDEFFKLRFVNSLIDYLVNRINNIKREELLYFFGTLQSLAFWCTLLAYADWLPNIKKKKQNIIIDLKEQDGYLFENFMKSKSKFDEDNDFINYMNINQFRLMYQEELNYSSYANNSEDDLFFFRDLSYYYFTALEKLISPDCHVACFTACYSNSSMWSHYADNHKGVCLKFNTRSSGGNKPSLILSELNGVKGKIVPDFTENQNYTRMYFEKVLYGNNTNSNGINFFESIPTLTVEKLENFWFRASKEGNISNTALGMRQNDNQWRKKYSDNLKNIFSSKSKDWEHEKEYRLILSAPLFKCEPLQCQKYKYNFEDLTGIIFGINTKPEDKRNIIQIIKKESEIKKGNGFDFFQAIYSSATKKIELENLNNLIN